MIEVFKTNVEDPNEAVWIIGHLVKIFPGYRINFDLDDCDRIMRVRCDNQTIESENILAVLNTAGFAAEVLEDDITMVP